MTIESSPLEVRRLAMFSVIVFLISACLFVLFRSNDILGTDGPFRSLEVYRRHSLFFHDSKHMLYPVNVLVWTRLAAAIGFHMTDPQSFYSVVVLMNCIAAAGCLALFFLLTSVVTRSWRLAALVTAIYGLSSAFLFQATNAAEPMVGILWSFLGVGVAALSWRTKSLWPPFLSGLLFALAMATYQSAVLLGPAALFVIWRSRLNAAQSDRSRSPGILAVFCFGISAALGSISIYGWAAYHRGQSANGSQSLIASLFARSESRAFFGVHIIKFVRIPVGLVHNVFPILSDYTGLRNLLRGPILPILGLVLLLLVVGMLFVFCAARLSRRWSSLTPTLRTSVLAAGLGLVFCLFPVATWSDLYDKLWLQPLACICFLLGISLHWISKEFVAPRLLTHVLPALVLAGVLPNLGSLQRRHAFKAPEMSEAQRLAAMVRPKDLVVGEWDGVSTLYGFGWAADDQYFSFTSNAATVGSRVISDLRNAVLKTQKAGGRVFFVNVLDLPKDSWDSFLGSRCGVSYSELDVYRSHSIVRATFETRSRPSTLMEFEPSQ